MTISVCMCTYNGEKYIQEQLKSILLQTRQPDEVLIYDDRSSDRTVEIIDAFIADNHLSDSWKVAVNEEKQGYPGNFYAHMICPMGDIVFLADQDDIWDGKKIEIMSGVMERNPSCNVVSCKFGLIDGDGNEIKSIMNPSKTRKSDLVTKVELKNVLHKYEWPGMVLAYRNNWYINRFGESNANSGNMIPHDFLIVAAASESGSMYQLDKELAVHRRHDANTAGEEHRILALLNKTKKLRDIDYYLSFLEEFQMRQLFETEAAKDTLQRKIIAMQARKNALESGKIAQVVRGAWRNRKEVRLATFVCDMVIVKRNCQCSEDSINGA